MIAQSHERISHSIKLRALIRVLKKFICVIVWKDKHLHRLPIDMRFISYLTDLTLLRAKMALLEKMLTLISSVIVCLTFPVSLFFCIKIVKDYERCAVFRLGYARNNKAFGPGIVLSNRV